MRTRIISAKKNIQTCLLGLEKLIPIPILGFDSQGSRWINDHLAAGLTKNNTFTTPTGDPRF